MLRIRAWFAELNQRADEVRATFKAETVRAEQAYLIPGADGPVLIYAMEADNFESGRQAYADSNFPIDHEHRAVMQECMGESLGLRPLYDVAVMPSAGPDWT